MGEPKLPSSTGARLDPTEGLVNDNDGFRERSRSVDLFPAWSLDLVPPYVNASDSVTFTANELRLHHVQVTTGIMVGALRLFVASAVASTQVTIGLYTYVNTPRPTALLYSGSRTIISGAIAGLATVSMPRTIELKAGANVFVGVQVSSAALQLSGYLNTRSNKPYWTSSLSTTGLPTEIILSSYSKTYTDVTPAISFLSPVGLGVM